MIKKALVKKLDILSKYPHLGDPIKKSTIPPYYKEKYSAHNLFRIELPLYWRMLYTLTADDTELEIIAFVLDVCNHEEYDKKFGYKKK